MRDGLQLEEPVPLAAKVDMIEALVATGVRRIEVTSFVSPRAVPALADADHSAGLSLSVRAYFRVRQCLPVGSTKRDQVSDQIAVLENRTNPDRRRFVNEVGEDLRRSDPIGVTARLPAGIPGGVDERRQPRIPAHHRVDCRGVGRHTEQHTRSVIGDHHLARRVDGGKWLG